MSVKEMQFALEQLRRINEHLSNPCLLIGGLAVWHYVQTRRSVDIDLVIDDESINELIDQLFPTSNWEREDTNNDPIRPSWILINAVSRDRVKLGPKILERTAYPHLDWNDLCKTASPYKYQDETFDKVLIPSATSLAYSKIVAFVARDRSKSEKRMQDLKDFRDLTNDSDFDLHTFETLMRRSGVKFPDDLTDEQSTVLEASSILRANELLRPTGKGQPSEPAVTSNSIGKQSAETHVSRDSATDSPAKPYRVRSRGCTVTVAITTSVAVIMSAFLIPRAFLGFDFEPSDVSNPGILVLSKQVDIDMSKRVGDVPSQELDTVKRSPVVHDYRIRAVRTSDSAKVLTYEFASQRKQMDITVQSKQPYRLDYRRDPKTIGEGFSHVRSIRFDVRQHSRDIPFTVAFRVVRWNAYQADNLNFVGHLVSANEDAVSTSVELPLGKALVSEPRTLKKEIGVADSDWVVYDGHSEVTVREQGKSLDWHLANPKKGWAYKVGIDWGYTEE